MALQSRTRTTNEKDAIEQHKKFEAPIVWKSVFFYLLFHTISIYALCTAFYRSLACWIFESLYGVATAIGITAGAHRLWAHRSYKAKLPLRIFLSICFSSASQTDIFMWCRDHRTHHKYTETDADPHNIKRGFFFAHCGWLMCKRHPDVQTKGKTVNMDDLLADPVVQFNKRFHVLMALFFGFCLPTMVIYWFFEETLWDSFFANFGRHAIVLHVTFCVNSVAHIFGDKPFDSSIHASDCGFLSWWAQGEGWHNYHHVFPWDYAASELGYHMNTSKLFIDFMAKIGQAYELKSASPDTILNRKLKTGDGTRLEGVKRD